MAASILYFQVTQVPVWVSEDAIVPPSI